MKQPINNLGYLSNHVFTKSGNFKGVCVSAVLLALGIRPDQYKYTWSTKAGNNYDNILRRFGYNVRSRKSVFKKATTVSQVCKLIKKYDKDSRDTYYMISVSSHVLLVASNGNVIVDTASRVRDRRKVLSVRAVFK